MRRLRFDLIHAYKIIFGVIDTDADSFSVRCTNETTRGHNMKLFVPQSRIDIHNYFFSRRIVQRWNDLPACSEDFASLASFRRLLSRTDHVWLHNV